MMSKTYNEIRKNGFQINKCIRWSMKNYFIINEVTQNADAGFFSTYLYKDITGKLKLVTWDFNNSVDNYIEVQQEVSGFFMQQRTWFFMLLKDEDFTEKVIRRYRSLRDGVLHDQNIISYIEDVDFYLGNAVDRNFQVWGDSFLPENDLLIGEGRAISTHKEAIDKYQNRLIERMHWLDEHIEDLYSYSHESTNKMYND